MRQLLSPRLLLLAALPLLAGANDYPKLNKLDVKLPPFAVDLQSFTFPSGLRVLFQPDHSVPVVSITYVSDRGSTADPEGLEGIAHVVEHLWFRSKQLDANGQRLPKIWDVLEDLGAEINAFTADDQTVYMTVGPREQLEALMRIERLRLLSAVEGVTADVLAVEIDVVRNELRMRYENSTGAVWGALNVLLYPRSHPYGKAAFAGIGSHESLNNITIEDVQQFVKKNYGPSLTTIVVAGDFDIKDSAKLLEHLGAEVMVDPKNPTAPLALVENAPPRVPQVKDSDPVPPPAVPAEVKGRLTGMSRVKGPVKGPVIAMGWRLPKGWRGDEALWTLLSERVGYAISTSLVDDWEWGQAEPALEGFGCFPQSALDGSALACVIELKAGEDANERAERALDGLYRAWTLPDGFESDAGLVQKYNGIVLMWDKMGGMASLLQSVDLIASLFSERVTSAAMYTHYTGDAAYFSAMINQINGVTNEQVTELARTLITRDRAAITVMEPYEKEDITRDSSDSSYRGASRESESSTVLSGLNRDRIVGVAKPPDLAKLTETTLPNGMKVHVMDHGDSPLLMAALRFEGGTRSLPGSLGDFVDASLDVDWRGVDTAGLASYESVSVGEFSTDFSFAGSAGNIEESLFVLRTMVEGLRADTSGKIDWVEAKQKAVKRWMKEPEGWADILPWERLAPGHPLGDWEDHTELKEYKKLGNADVNSAFASILRPERGHLVLVGNVDAKQVADLANTYFGSWAGFGSAKNVQPLKMGYDPLPPPPPRTVLLIDKPISSQADITYRCQLAKRTVENSPAMTVLAAALDEGAWIALRENSGKSYGAGAGSSKYLGGPAFLTISSLVQNDGAVLGVESFLKLAEDAKAGKLDPNLVARKQYSINGSYVIGHQSVAQMASRLLGPIAWGEPMTDLAALPARIADVRLADMQAVLEPCVGHEVITVVGPVDVLKPMFDTAKIPVEVFDWEQARKDYYAKHKLKLPKVKDEEKEGEETGK